MTYPLVQFVSAPTETATVRFDFNEDTWSDEKTWPEHDGFSLGAPPLEGDPDGVGVEYGFRELSFNLLIRAPKPAALARQSALAREILRQTNWLRFQLDEFSRPVWFKTYRTAPGELSFEHVYTERGSDLWGLSVSLTADPFAYGERESFTVSVGNRPTVPGGLCATLPEIKGDAPTPAVLALTPGVYTWHGMTPMVSVAKIPDGITWTTAHRWQATAFAMLTDASMQTSDPDFYFGGDHVAITFATTGLVGRLSGPAPLTPPSGRYAVYVRVASNVDNGVFTMALHQIRGGTTVRAGSAVQWNVGPVESGGSNRQFTYVNLGDFTFPHGIDMRDPDVGTAAAPEIALLASRTSGLGTLRINGFILVPLDLGDGAEARTIRSAFIADGLTPTRFGRWNGEYETFHAIDPGDIVTGIQPASVGDFPVLHPGSTNLLHVFMQTNHTAIPTTLNSGTDLTAFSGSHSDRLGETTGVAVTYQPRYLYLAGD